MKYHYSFAHLDTSIDRMSEDFVQYRYDVTEGGASRKLQGKTGKLYRQIISICELKNEIRTLLEDEKRAADYFGQ